MRGRKKAGSRGENGVAALNPIKTLASSFLPPVCFETRAWVLGEDRFFGGETMSPHGLGLGQECLEKFRPNLSFLFFFIFTRTLKKSVKYPSSKCLFNLFREYS